MNRITIQPKEHPRKVGESWYVVHPNSRGCEFRIPYGAVTGCLEDFQKCKQGVLYSVLSTGNSGWVAVKTADVIYEMPEYVFARYFDAEAFVVGAAPTPGELEKAEPFDYKPTVPAKEKQRLETFNDTPPHTINCGSGPNRY